MSASVNTRSSRRKQALIKLPIADCRLPIGGRSLAALAATLILSCALPLDAAPRNQSPIISANQDGRLAYHADERGNRVPDFSSCGYAGGDRPIPNAPVQVVVEPRPGDSTARIQQAIDYVAGLPLDTNGLRGAVLLLKGRHEILGGLHITNSGVALRGQGMDAEGTILVATGLDRRTLIRVVGRNDSQTRSNEAWRIKDDYVPVGATRFQFLEAAGLKAGDNIRITRPSTQAWIEELGATEFGGGVGGGWKPGSRNLVWERVVKSVTGDLVTIDSPITTAIEKTNPGRGRGDDSQTEKTEKLEPPHVVSYTWPGRITNIGIENLRLESTFDAGNPKDENHSWCAITMENTGDAWVRQVTFQHFAGSAVALHETCQRVTVQDCLSLAPVSEIGGYRRHTFFTMGQQTLFLRCYAEHGRHDFSVGHCAAGPNAFVQCEAREALDDSGPIESWASGVLYDNVNIDGNALTLGYRPGSNAGIGWAAANCVLWNCSASVIRCWNPPGAVNWSFGSWASFEGDGVWKSSNDFMKPDSLFAEQLKNRLGAEAAARLQLMPRPREESSNPPLDKAQELAAASHVSAPQLCDYIAAASKRDPISSDPGNAKRIEDTSSRSSRREEALTSNRKSEIINRKLEITNGWLTLDGKLLTGGSASVTWWRGSIRPNEAKEFGLGVTRFVPGRSGPGFTDDLDEVADKLTAGGDVALDHNYGLWYDRRRDDHERVRRINGDVLPPFYEQPFARSGEGTAWLGLSKYDLTKFNPWYWARLREFAELCEQRGLVLFHQNYFQHNILEAGAHWADSPWRSANNINNPGFPEPPPYAGDKRIFQAELFYDVNHPVRRKLHEGYIRQCLENFKTNANVIQFTSAEFTGPLHFMQFWLDTIGQWETENHHHPLVGLSATKDVQDGILADPKRGALVDVIDFRYWWNTDKGLFAPNGGLNLAPRQFERQWKGGRPNEANLAQMAADYRGRFPGKAVICNVGRPGWAYLCAGGSMPNLPRTTDARLLAAIPRMTPWVADTEKKTWMLREAGRGCLIYSGNGGEVEIDLRSESGRFAVSSVSESGAVKNTGEPVDAGRIVTLKKSTNGRTVFWLTKD